MSQPIIVLDLETTSPDPGEARIVTLFVGVLGPDGDVLHEYQTIVRPDGFTIPAGAIEIHGITNERARRDGVPLDDALTSLFGFLIASDAHPIAGQNIVYDLTVIDRELRRTFGHRDADEYMTWLSERNILDSLVLDRHLVPRRDGRRNLESLAAAYGVPLSTEDAHGARADAVAAGRIVQQQLAHPAIDGHTAEQLHVLQGIWRAEQQASLEQWLRERASPPQPHVVLSRHWPLIPFEKAAAA